MEHRLNLLLAMLAMAAFPVSATTVTMDTVNSATIVPGVTQTWTPPRSSASTHQAAADKSARKVAKAAAKQARKCAKWARKAASARSDRKRARYSARYNASCVATATAKTETPIAPASSAVVEVLSSIDTISSFIAPSAVLRPTAMATGSSGSSAMQGSSGSGAMQGSSGSGATQGNGVMTSAVVPVAARLAPELVAARVPEPGTLALLGLGLAGLGLSLRRKAS